MKQLNQTVGFVVVILALNSVWAGDKTSRVPMPSVTTYKAEKCVAATDEMRLRHMEKLLHQRDRTVRDGVRTKKYSLKNCVNCHADPKTESVLGKDGFCQSCHEYAAVSIDCFSCHTDKAETKAASKEQGQE